MMEVDATDNNGGGWRWKLVDPDKAGLGRGFDGDGRVDNGVGGLLGKMPLKVYRILDVKNPLFLLFRNSIFWLT
jgi:hypothetical protein